MKIFVFLCLEGNIHKHELGIRSTYKVNITKFNKQQEIKTFKAKFDLKNGLEQDRSCR